MKVTEAEWGNAVCSASDLPVEEVTEYQRPIRIKESHKVMLQDQTTVMWQQVESSAPHEGEKAEFTGKLATD